jgi:endonuclease-8
VGFSLGIVEVVPRQEEASLTAHLGPDLLGPDWDLDKALARLRCEPERPVGQALLDQRNLAGIGNMYMAELCFTSGVHPATAVSRVADLPRLVRRARLMLEANKERAIQSTTGDLRPGERLWVYRRDKSPCRRCGTPILVDMLGEPGLERAAYWCPSCQPVS